MPRGWTKQQPHIITAGGPLPNTLLFALRDLALETQNGKDATAEPCSKRRRVEQVESIPVLRPSFTISRPTQTPPLINDRITCHDAGRYLTFSLDKKELFIRSKPKAPFDAFACQISFDRNFTDDVVAALEVSHLSREDETQDGALTVRTSISLDESDDMHHMRFTLTVNLNTATFPLRNAKQRKLSQRIIDLLGKHSPSQSLADPNNTIAPSTFYQAAFMPSRESFNDLEDVSIPGLHAKLYPFQRRAVQWLLMREGVRYNSTESDGTLQLTEYPQLPKSTLPLSFRCFNDVNGQQYYMSDLYHLATRDITPFQETMNGLRGGILAEEMGLGKTVEIISLILTHERGPLPITKLGRYNDKVLRPTGATLIVTPETLQNQWCSEFNKHAPDLLVMKYPGIKVWAKDKAMNVEKEGESLLTRCITKLANCDVIITTYNVLQAELHFALVPPQRSMRYEKKHERHTSPLVQIDWWRVCLDEAQQIDTGVSSAAKVACLIPRVNAWAVTGTPVKDNPNDLWGLLLFLGYEPFVSYQVAWKALLSTHKALFGPLFNRIAIRHSKHAVRDELRLPPQKRHIVTMPFTAIEEHHYQSEFRALVGRAGLSEQGTPLEADWDPDDPFVVEFMKKALACLRQTILHPELGTGAPAKVSVYKTLAEHLEAMIEQSDASIKTHQRSYLIAKLSKGQLLENTPRVKEALQIWDEVREEVEPIVIEARDEFKKVLEAAQLERRNERVNQNGEPPDEEAETAKVGDSRRKLRLFLDLQHRVTFFIASAYFQIKSDETLTEPESDEFKRLEQRETEGYELARKLRREILQEPLAKVSKLMEKLRERAQTQSFVEIPEIVTSDFHGLESGRIAEDLQNLGASLNEQADLVDDWREHIIQLLLKPLVDTEDEEEITGEEYEDSTKVQDHLMVYTLALGAVIGDRQEALTGLINERIRYETAAAERMAKDEEGHAPEKLLELLQTRQSAKPLPAGQSLRGVISALRELSTNLRHDASAGSARARVELEIVVTHLKTTQDILTKQNKVAVNLEKDLEFFTTAMNARVDYYRQLQSVSDNVAPLPPEISTNQDRSWNGYVAQEAELRKKADYWLSSRRHLIHMRDDASVSTEPCAICRDDNFTVGAITTCGHTFCEECIVQWLKAKYKCPLCKVYQHPSMLSQFNRVHTNVQAQLTNSFSPSLGGESHRGSGLYTNIDDEQRRAIQNVKLHGPSYSSKIDTLIKHLVWLREEDPGAKSIIFTQFRSFLQILGQALEDHRIGFSTFSRWGNKSLEIQRFKDDPSVECLLMDAKAHSSGLNLVNANHVFLCEPLLNTALEFQAIARVDRIGQEHETAVWLYLVEGTVEEHIHVLSERRRLAHIGNDEKGKSLETVTTDQVGLTESHLSRLMSKEDDGEVIEKGDLYGCLFGSAVQT